MKMKYIKIITGVALACAVAIGCSDQDFVDANTNPDIFEEAPPENQFLTATLNIHNQDREAFYDYYQRIMPWMQYVAPIGGNNFNFTSNVNNFSTRYSRLYLGIGDVLTDMEQTVAKRTAEQQAQYVHMLAISKILKSYYTFYVSDIYGDIPYANAWQARYGGTQLPTYDDQQALFIKLDETVKNAVTALKTAQPTRQVPLAAFDQYFQGDAQAWVRAGNALRLRMATRWVKRDANRATIIATEVLGSPAADLMSENSHGWVLKALAGLTNGNDFNPDRLYGTKPVVDFMWDKKDPRLDAFFSPNTYTKLNIDSLIKEGELPPGTTEPARRYFGSFPSPDEAQATANRKKWYTPRTARVNKADVRVDTLSLIQRRLFQPSFDEGNGTGTGNVHSPVITYAEFCFLRAELAALGITTEDAETFYDKGVVASIEWYNMVAVDSKLSNYTALTATEITDYMATLDITFDPARALNQIASQAYLNLYRQPTEGWALWKRTGFPNTTTVLALADLKSNGAAMQIARRSPLPLLSEASVNYTNQKAAYDKMLQDPAFGAGANDAFGRVWWDKP